MDVQNEFKELFKYGSKSPENRKKVITIASKLIFILEETGNKSLSKEELNSIIGGGAYITKFS